MKQRLKEISITAPSFLWLTLFFLIPTLVVATFSIRIPEPDGGLGKGWSFGTLDILFEQKGETDTKHKDDFDFTQNECLKIMADYIRLKQ